MRDYEETCARFTWQRLVKQMRPASIFAELSAGSFGAVIL